MATIRPFERLLRCAGGRAQTLELLRALGFEPATVAGAEFEPRASAGAPDAAGPPARGGAAPAPVALPPAAFGLPADDGVAAVVPAGERGGLEALLIELADAGTADTVGRLARRLRAHNAARPRLFAFAGAGYRRLVLATFGLDGRLRQLPLERDCVRPSDIEALEELAACDGEGGVALAARHGRVLDRSRLTRRFFNDFRAQRAAVAAAWEGLPRSLAAEREQLALLFLGRLLFLYFLQRHGHLAGDPDYLPGLFRRWRRRPGTGSFFRAVLTPLFFGALNTRPADRSPEALALGRLPYLNGGLFERHALERRFPDLDLPDPTTANVFDALLEHYRFTTRDAATVAGETGAGGNGAGGPAEPSCADGSGGAGDGGIDPEMLGRVFEGLMAADRRSTTGTFFTPAPLVDRLVREALECFLAGRTGSAEAARRLVRHGTAQGLDPETRRRAADALAQLRVLDPACGSGAFLLGALTRVTRLRALLGGGDPRGLRRDIVARTLHGVDVQDDAALLCALRLWLALAVEEDAGSGDPPPLPNLDRRIRQGDALLDPLDLPQTPGPGAGPGVRMFADHEVRQSVRALVPLSGRYLTAEPAERAGLQREVGEAERRLALAWVGALERRVAHRLAEARAQAAERDLFGERGEGAAAADRAVAELERRSADLARIRRATEEDGALPFFSFPVHFAEATATGFDLVLSNPPWVRAHRWPQAVGRMVRERYAVCRAGGWKGGTQLAAAPPGVAAQVDLSLLFLERSLELLAPGGVVAMVLPAKALRSLYGAGARRMLLRETRIAALEDHSLDQRSIFQADAFAATVIARREERTARGPGAAPEPAPVRVTMVRRGAPPLRFELPQDEFPLVPGDADAPWLIAPPEVLAALRAMAAAGPPLGSHPALRIRRGIVTGANEVLLVPHVQPKLGGIALIRAEGFRRAVHASRSGPGRRAFCAAVESSALRPVVRGRDIDPFCWRTSGYVLWCHDDATAEPRPAPPRVERYLARHARRLEGRTGLRPGLPLGCVFRLSAETLGPKVAWHDLAETLEAVALPGEVRGVEGRGGPLVPLNTVYFIPVAGEEQALVLAGLLNSLPVRTYARAVAERAKDARFRFFAWTVGALPLPRGWAESRAARTVLRLSRGAHERGAITDAEQTELDAAVAALYRLGGREVEALASFDHWLKGART